jgi:lipoprotein-anchoring transpeptidase ErfK/SrfK
MREVPAMKGIVHAGRPCLLSSLLLALLLSACGAAPTQALPATSTPSLTALPSHTPSVPSTPTATYTPTLTPEPDWYQPIDAAYSNLEYRYGVVNDPQARVYASLQDAVSHNGNFGLLPSAPADVAVMGEETRDGLTYYAVTYGWMSAADVQLLTPSSLRGLQITRPVAFRFGWVLTNTWSVNLAGTPIREYLRYDIIHEVPAETENPGFVAVGPDEWLPEASVALTSASVPADAGENTCRFIYVDLTRQTLRVYDQCQLVFATLVSTGKQPGWTVTGRFGILVKFPHILLTPPWWSTSVYYQEGVPKFMTFYGDLGFHGAYWHDDFGAAVSHGCINISPADANWLYEWASIGERVIISQGE